MITVLMYHAIPDDGPVQPGADPHYSVGLRDFERQLGLMRTLGLRPSSVAELLVTPVSGRAAVAITFDDGHVTNHAAAASLHAAGGSADFFINPSTVGTPGFLSWAQLREMAGWGMSIQSHGMHHHFLNDLGPAEVRAELADSKSEIEARLGRAVTLYAPAGGRVVPGLHSLALGLGYERICSSRVDLWDEAAELAGDDSDDIPRLAMLAGTQDAQLQRWLRQSRLEMTWQTGRHALLRSAKQALGNRAYVLLRGRLLRSRGEGQA
ncbi:MAG: hypothetical protein RLZZ584_2424 [Pseudomonadota bacterium]|jgi:peptidoglycan/xylan/chitin deacetylase (PgdA/CDA1 family)